MTDSRHTYSEYLGRSDNMVEIKASTVCPMRFGGILDGLGDPDLAGEFLCVLINDSAGGENLDVQVEHRASAAADASAHEAMFAQRLGARVGVTLVGPRATSTMTKVERRQKPIRLIDRGG